MLFLSPVTSYELGFHLHVAESKTGSFINFSRKSNGKIYINMRYETNDKIENIRSGSIYTSPWPVKVNFGIDDVSKYAITLLIKDARENIVSANTIAILIAHTIEEIDEHNYETYHKISMQCDDIEDFLLYCAKYISHKNSEFKKLNIIDYADALSNK